jgi:hypothetical protein
MHSDGKTRRVAPGRTRYIKLGEGGAWEKQCLRENVIRFSFGTGRPELFPLCVGGDWKRAREIWIADGRGGSTATRFANEARMFFEDDGTTLWITFHGETLWWAFLEPGQPTPYSDQHSVTRPVVGAWCSKDLNGEQLSRDRLSGSVNKLSAYRGTSCSIDVEDYLVRRINGEKTPQVERAIGRLKAMRDSALELMRLLGPHDFETLVDLVFSTSGWRRQGVVGKTQKTLDLDLMLPSTGERAFVQVKARTDAAEFESYLAQLDSLGPYHRMFYVFHTGSVETDDERVTIVGPERLAELVVDAGLVDWLLRKVS